MKTLTVFLLLLGVVYPSLLQYRLKAGEKAEIGQDKHVKTWERVRDGKKEYIKFCEPGDNAIHCIKFVTEDGKVAQPETKATVLESGKLILEKAARHDSGLYSSPDAEHHPNHAPATFNLKVE